MTIRLLAAVNKTVSSASGILTPGADTTRVSFQSAPLTQAELLEICRAAGVQEFKMLMTIPGLASQLSQRPKWRSARIVLVDAITIDDARGLMAPLDQPVRAFEQIKTGYLEEGQSPRTIIGLIPHSKVEATDIQYLRTAGVDEVCTPSDLKNVIPKLLKKLAS